MQISNLIGRLLLIALVQISSANVSPEYDIVDPSCAIKDARIATAADPPFEINDASSIVEFFSPKLADDAILAKINSNLLDGKLVVIRDAFIPEFAEYAWAKLSRNDTNWVHNQKLNPSGYKMDINLNETPETSPALLQMMKNKLESSRKKVQSIKSKFSTKNPGHNRKKHDYKPAEIARLFEATSTRDFLNSISGRSPVFRIHSNAAEFRKGDYSNPHTDFVRSSISVIWDLSKDWDPSWGGAFYWGSSKTLEEGFIYPTFNTLLLFLPTRVSIHGVTPVTPNANGRRFTIAGLPQVKDAFDESELIEHMYGNKQDLIKLSPGETVWIAHKMAPEQFTRDEKRHQPLRELKRSVIDNYLYREDQASFQVEAEQDDESVDSIDGHQTNETGTIVTQDSSILDYLDPSILEDDELLLEMKTNLLKGKLVVIQEAFKPDFAEYVWELLAKDDLEWKRTSNEQTADITGSTYSKHVLVDSSLSTKISDVIGILHHPKTKEFFESISGRSCTGAGTNITPVWHKKDDYSSPHTEFTGSNALSFSWLLSKDWDKSYGGAMFWYPTQLMDEGYHHAAFNTLMLFLPTPSSTHTITPVSFWSEGKRLSLGGCYQSEKIDIEDFPLKEEDYIRLTSTQAMWLVDDMDVDNMVDDPIRKQQFRDLKEDVDAKYLHPRQSEVTVFV